MEQNNLIIALDVPYQVEIVAHGVPLHKAKVEFCIEGSDVSYNFPAKMITDEKFVFTLNDAVSSLVNSSLTYRLYVYYGNARFEADTGQFNLVDAEAFEAEVIQPDLEEKINNLGPKKPKATPKAKSKGKAPKVTSSVPKPTPTPTVTTTLKEAKRLLGERVSTNESTIPGMMRVGDTVVAPAPVIEETPDDINTRIREALASLGKTATPPVELQATPVNEGKQKPNFFAEVEKMRKINEDRAAKKAARDAKPKKSKQDEKVQAAIQKSHPAKK